MESFIAPCLPNYYWAGGVATTGNSVCREPAPWTMMMMMKKQAEREVFQVDDLFDFSHQQNDGNRDKDEVDWTGFTAFTDDEKRYNCSNDEAGLNNNKLEGGDVSLMVDEAEFEACMPAVDELEWLGNFMEDDNSSYYYHCFNFDADDANAQLQQGVVPTCTPPTTIKEKEKEEEKEEVEEEISAVIHPCRKAKLDKASKARSKRSRGDSSSVKSARTWSIGGGLVVHTEEESQASTTCSADLSSSSSSSSMGAVDSSPLPPPLPAKKAKKGCLNEAQRQAVTRRCSHCGVDKTPQWRAGPSGPKSLCNACGVRFKSGRLFPEYRPAASPTFMSHIHSNSHRQVLEIRKQKETSSFYCTTTTEEKKSTTQENSRTIELGEAPLSKITTEESGSFF